MTRFPGYVHKFQASVTSNVVALSTVGSRGQGEPAQRG